MCFSVTYITAVANLVDRDQVTDANGRLQASAACASIIGPALAGVIAARFGPATALGVDALSFAVSALSLACIRLRSATGAASGRTVRTRHVAELLAGVRFLWQQPVLRALTCMIAGFSFLTLGALDLFVYHLRHDLGQNDRAVGLVFSIASTGAIAGGLLAAPVRRRWGFGVCYLGSAIIEGVVLAGIGLAPAVVVMLPLVAGFTFLEILKGVNSIALRQQVTPDYLLGRVTAAFWTINSAPGPIGAALLPRSRRPLARLLCWVQSARCLPPLPFSACARPRSTRARKRCRNNLRASRRFRTYCERVKGPLLKESSAMRTGLRQCGWNRAAIATVLALLLGSLVAVGNATSVSADLSVTIVNFAFMPVSLTIPVGTTVVWTNQDAESHTATSDPAAPSLSTPGRWRRDSRARSPSAGSAPSPISASFTRNARHGDRHEYRRARARRAVGWWPANVRRPGLPALWAKTDANPAGQSYIWGPAPFTGGLMEEYKDAPGGKRLVQYFDKARMELNDTGRPGDGGAALC